MSDLLAARSQMAMSLAFHIVFAAVGIAMPLLMLIAEGLWLRTRRPVYLDLAKRWARGTAIMFAVGAVSGTVLSFELGLLWPTFMRHAGPVVGMPFSLEGFAFFTEAIFLGIYLYGWNRVPERAHWLAGLAVLVSGTLSGVFVVTANAWMNTPAGFDFVDGRFVNVRPFQAMLNPAAFSEVLHSTLAAFLAIGTAVAGIHAARLYRDPRNPFHRAAFAIALAVMGGAAILQPLAGDIAARHVARYQPVKLAAMEAQWETESSAPLRIGGWPSEAREETRWSLEIPGALSLMAFGDRSAEITGLKTVPPELRPPVLITHLAFQVMVGIGFLLPALALLGGVLAWRARGLPEARWYFRLLALATPTGLVALEAGWVVTEVGRQPWIVAGFLKTAEAVTPMPWLVVPFLAFTALYLLLGVVVLVLMWRHVLAIPSATAFPGEA
jgi:cytochrome d ubiquinol oxidase subunit I